MPLMKSLTRFLRSPQGKKLARQAQDYAKSPEGKAKIEQVQAQLKSRTAGKGSKKRIGR